MRSSKIFEWGRLRSREQCGFKIPLSETAIAEAAEAWSSGAAGAPEAAEAAGVAWAAEAVEAAEAAEAAEGGRGRSAGRTAEAVVEGPRGSPRRHNTQCHNVEHAELQSVCPNHTTPHVRSRHRGNESTYKRIATIVRSPSPFCILRYLSGHIPSASRDTERLI